MDRSIVLVNTVVENHKGFTRQEYKGDKAARCALGLVGYPSEREFTKMASSNMIVNFPVTPADIKNANKIFDPDVPCMKVKLVRRCPEAVVPDYVDILEDILSMNTVLEVSVDVIFVNKLAFLVSVSKRVSCSPQLSTPPTVWRRR